MYGRDDALSRADVAYYWTASRCKAFASRSTPERRVVRKFVALYL
jgi:hypothetical protein